MSAAEQRNFTRLVYDIVWFWFALAATSRFLSLFAIRLGADSLQLSLIASLPGIILFFSTGASTWWRRRHKDSVKALLLPTLTFRLIFLLPALTPFMPPELRPWWLIFAVSLPAIPQGMSGAIFIAMMRETVSTERFSALLSRRALAMNVTIGIGAIAFGILLETLPFPYNYQLMFLIAFGFALISYYYVVRLNVLFPEPPPPTTQHYNIMTIWRIQSFRSVGIITLFTHLTFFSIVMVTPVHLVESLGFSEGFMALFGLAELTSSAIIAMFTQRWFERGETQTLIAIGMGGTAVAAVLIALATGPAMALAGALFSGASWTVVTIGAFTLLIERTTKDDATHTAIAFQQVVALGIFIGSLIGGFLLDSPLNPVNVLIFGAMLRLFTALMTVNSPVKQALAHPLRLKAAHRQSRHG